MHRSTRASPTYVGAEHSRAFAERSTVLPAATASGFGGTRAVEILNLSRRDLLLGTAWAGAGLIVAALLPQRLARAAGLSRDLGPWIRIGSDGAITLFVEKAEMGQGVHTALPMLLAEELEVDWQQVRVQAKPLEGGDLGTVTGNSSSVRSSWAPLSQAGAAAREMLLQAAATRWGVPATECTARAGRVLHRASDRSLAFSALAVAAAQLPTPKSVKTKPASAPGSERSQEATASSTVPRSSSVARTGFSESTAFTAFSCLLAASGNGQCGFTVGANRDFNLVAGVGATPIDVRQTFNVTVAPIPEPGALLAFAVGIATVGFVRRRG